MISKPKIAEAECAEVRTTLVIGGRDIERGKIADILQAIKEPRA